jgi:hypothetical protein
MSGKQRLNLGSVRVDEHALVSVVCVSGRLRPRAITFSDRSLLVANILREWNGVHQGSRLRYFLVTAADGSHWKLCFQSQECAWLVEEISTPPSL